MKFDEIWWKYVIFDEYTGAIFASSKLRACMMWFFFGVSNFGQGFTKEVDLISTGSFSCTSTNFWKFLSYSGRSRRDLPRKCSLPKSNATVDVEKIRSKCKIVKNFSFATKILVSCKALTFFFAGGTSRSRRDLLEIYLVVKKECKNSSIQLRTSRCEMANFRKKVFFAKFFFSRYCFLEACGVLFSRSGASGSTLGFHCSSSSSSSSSSSFFFGECNECKIFLRNGRLGSGFFGLTFFGRFCLNIHERRLDSCRARDSAFNGESFDSGAVDFAFLWKKHVLYCFLKRKALKYLFELT